MPYLSRPDSESWRTLAAFSPTTPGAVSMLGTAVDLSTITVDTYVVAGIRDHISPWQACYRSARLLSGTDARFVLSSSGHIAALVNPPVTPGRASMSAKPKNPTRQFGWREPRRNPTRGGRTSRRGSANGRRKMVAPAAPGGGRNDGDRAGARQIRAGALTWGAAPWSQYPPGRDCGRPAQQ